MPPVSSTSDLAPFPLLPLRATVYRHRIFQAIEHPYQDNQSLVYASSRRWPGANSVLDHPHICHNLHASSSLIDLHSPSHCSLGGCYRYLSSLNVGLSYVEIRVHSSTTMTMPLPTHITNGTNDLANTPTDASMNLNICSTLNNSSHNARPSPRFKTLLDESALACWSVEGWKFRFPHDCKRRYRCRPSLGLRTRAKAECAKFELSTICSTIDCSLGNSH